MYYSIQVSSANFNRCGTVKLWQRPIFFKISSLTTLFQRPRLKKIANPPDTCNVQALSMILHCEDQIVLDVQFNLQVDEPYASGQAWMPFLLNTQTFFSVLVMLIINKLDVFKSMKIRRLQIQIQVDKNPGKTILWIRNTNRMRTFASCMQHATCMVTIRNRATKIPLIRLVIARD